VHPSPGPRCRPPLFPLWFASTPATAPARSPFPACSGPTMQQPLAAAQHRHLRRAEGFSAPEPKPGDWDSGPPCLICPARRFFQNLHPGKIKNTPRLMGPAPKILKRKSSLAYREYSGVDFIPGSKAGQVRGDSIPCRSLNACHFWCHHHPVPPSDLDLSRKPETS
jgi:hypothetical protein